ncbi:MAG: archaellin/type IV pilin N-terminal domain-containing protein [Candidatus Bathyarchaeia archaeon]
MKKLWKNIKALSPVVAAIILIAVTVAVSIAVAAWMGALTFTFTKTEELKPVGHSWVGNNQINITVTNTGASDLVISGAQVDDQTATFSAGTTSLAKGSSTWVLITKPSGNFIAGVKYNFAILTATGNKYTYAATKP